MPRPPLRVAPSLTDPRLVHVERDDGARFTLPLDTASRLGLYDPSAGGVPSAPPPSADISAPAEPAAPPSAESAPDPTGFGAFLAGLAAQPAEAPPAPPQTPPQATLDAAAVPEDQRAQLAPLLTPQGQAELGALPPPQAHAAPTLPAGVPPAAAEVLGRQPPQPQAQVPLGNVLPPPATMPRQEGETFIPLATPATGERPEGATSATPRRRAQATEEPTTEEPTTEEPPDLVKQLTERPRGEPLVPYDMRTSSPLEQAHQRIEEGRRLEQEAAHQEAVTAAERQDILEQAQAAQRDLAARRQAAMAAAQRRFIDAYNTARSQRMDPARFYHDRGAAGTIGVAIATALGGIGAALTGGPNQALATIERAIDRDIESQRANMANAQQNVGNARTFLGIARQQFNDEAAAQDAARSLAWNQVAERAAQQAAQLRDQGARLRAQELQADATARAQQAAQAAVQAQQDHELETRQTLANIRKTEAEATRAERRAGMAGGGGRARPGAVPREVIGTEEDPVVRQAIEFLGLDPVTAREQAANTEGGSRSGRQYLLRQITEAQQRRNRLPVGYTLEPGRTLTDAQIRSVHSLVAADREFNAAIHTIRDYAQRLRENGLLGYAWEQARGRAGFGSRDYQTINHAIDVIRTQFRNINQSGNSLGAQELASHDFPNLTENISLDSILNNIEAARDVKHRYVQAVLENNGISAAGGEDTGAEPQPAPPPEGVTPR